MDIERKGRQYYKNSPVYVFLLFQVKQNGTAAKCGEGMARPITFHFI